MRLPTIFNSLKVFKKLYTENIKSVIDVGVLNGTDFLMSEFKESKHYLFEPVSTFHESIKKNYEASGIRYELFGYAVSDKSGTMYLSLISGDASGKITHSNLSENYPEKLHERVINVTEVRVITLDEWAMKSKIEPPYIVKIDVDGIEEKIIDGGQSFLKNASMIIVESGLTNLATRSIKLQNLGFMLFDICDLCYYFELLSQVELLFINKQIFEQNINFQPWKKTQGKIIWEKWEPLTRSLKSFVGK